MIETGSQRFLKSSSAEIETLTQPFFPIGCPGKDDTAWIEVQTKTLEVYETLLSDLKEKGLEVGDIKDALPKNYRKVDYFVADYHAHVSQVLQVINKVLLSVGTEEQINTIVFLDKSGRIVAHLFKSMWNDLVNMGLINRSDKCPKIRFLNDGYDNWQKRKRISSMHVIDYIKRIAGRSSVLIVDEVISSGTTIRSALDNFEIAGVNILGGMSAYHFTPQWYGENDGVKGVDDVPIQEETYDAFEKLSEREFIFFKDIINRLRESNLFEEIIPPLIQGKLDGISEMLGREPLSFSTEEIERVKDIINKIKFDLMNAAPSREGKLDYAVKQIFLYFKYYAGYLAQPFSTSKERRTGYLYRRVLREMIRESTKHFYLTKEKDEQEFSDTESFCKDDVLEMMVQTDGKLARLLNMIKNLFSK